MIVSFMSLKVLLSIKIILFWYTYKAPPGLPKFKVDGGLNECGLACDLYIEIFSEVYNEKHYNVFMDKIVLVLIITKKIILL